MRERGFTLIELMIVVSIVGILVAISIPAYKDFMIRSRVTEVLATVSACKLNAVEFYQTHAGWANRSGANISTLDLCRLPNGTKHVQPAGLTINANGVIIALTRDLGPGVPNGTVLTMSPQVDGENVTSWICGAAGDGTTLEPRYRPGSCQG